MVSPASQPACQVAILAGGKGTRLLERTGADLPKPMVPLLGKPLLQYQIETCCRQGFQDIALLVHHQHEAIRDHFGDGSAFGVRLSYLIEATPRGTAGALRDALPFLAPRFIVLYGDTYLDVDLRAIWDQHGSSGVAGTLFLHPNDHPQDSDLVEIGDSGQLVVLHPYPHPVGHSYRNLVNAALYVLNREDLEDHLPEEGKADLAKHTFPAMLKAGKRLAAYISPEYIKDMGTPERLDRVSSDITSGIPERLSKRALRRAVFMDRDGTLNHEVDHLKDPEDLVLFPGVPAAIHRVNRSGRLAVVVTNQPVLARGELSFQGLDAIHARLDGLLGSGRAYLDAIYVCPHHPHRGFAGEVPELKVGCQCRKPDIGLIDRACRDLQVSRQESWFVGDTTTDMEAGRRAGLRTVLVRTGYSGLDRKYDARPDYIAAHLSGAVEWILSGHRAMTRKLLPFLANRAHARTILIGGLSRSGKSSAAQVLKEIAATQDRIAHILPLDSWLLPAENRRESYGVLSRYDLAAAEACLGRLAAPSIRHEFELPIYDPLTRRPGPDVSRYSIGPEDVIIVEGVPALASPTLLALSDAKLYVESEETIRQTRLLEYYRWRGLAEAHIEALLQSRAEDETGLVKASRDHADFYLSPECQP